MRICLAVLCVLFCVHTTQGGINTDLFMKIMKPLTNTCAKHLNIKADFAIRAIFSSDRGIKDVRCFFDCVMKHLGWMSSKGELNDSHLVSDAKMFLHEVGMDSAVNLINSCRKSIQLDKNEECGIAIQYIGCLAQNSDQLKLHLNMLTT